MVLRFAGYELDRPRAELRGPDGEAIKLRPKNFALLRLFAESSGRTLSKQELMDAIWPNVHVGDASLFQCIRVIRTAIGDDRREMIKLVSGSGYRFEPEVSVKPPTGEPALLPIALPAVEAEIAAAPASPWRRFGRVRNVAFAVAGIAAMAGVGIVIFAARPPSIAVIPITAAGGGEISAMAAGVTTHLADGLAKIENIRVTAPQDSRARQADFVVNGELEQSERSWQLRARMTRTATGDVVWTAPVSVALDDSDLSLQQSRLAAGIGHPLARRINELLGSAPRALGGGSPPGSAKVVIEQATASIVQTSRERFATAQSMLEKALAADPDNAELAVALASLQLRGIQMVWYSPAESAAAEIQARSILERALRSSPHSISVLEAYCRFLNATNEFAESLVACSRALNFDPWNGLALYHIGLAQVQMGRFEDALAVFKQADRFDTPRVSRWTWQLGAGMTYLLMDRSEEALPWLQRSISITPASGRTHMLLSAAYGRLGQPAAAKAAMDKALTLRPGSNLANIALPPKNASPVFLAAAEWIGRAYVEAGLPER